MNLPDYLRAQVSDETRYFAVNGSFELESGVAIDDVVIAYRTWGDIANATDGAILIFHALTVSADV
jgi:homoserine acetyltransferase